MNQAFPIALPRRVLLPGFEIDLARDELRTADGAHVELRPRSFAVLRLLAANAGRLVTKDEIMDKVWDDAVVTEDSLTQCIADIRRAIGDDERRIVRTIPRRGYLLVSARDGGNPVQPVSLPLPPPTLAPEEAATPERRGRGWYVIGALTLLLLVVSSGLALYALNVASVRRLLGPDASQVASVGPSVAVMPIEDLSGGRGTASLADGLTEDIIAALSRFKELRVLARNMTAGLAAKQNSPVEIGRLLKADYLVEGSVRTVDGQAVISVQLIDANGGAEVWAQTYVNSDAARDPSAFFSEVASRASTSVGTWTGAIAANAFRKSQTKSIADLTGYECIARAYAAQNDRISNEALRLSRECLHKTLEREPGNGAAWARLSLTLAFQRWWGLGLDAAEARDLDKRAYLADAAITASQRAIELAPNDSFARFAAANAYFLICRRDLLRVEAERALALNPNDASVMGPLGNILGFAGFWELGRQMAEKAIALTAPNTPRWWWWVIAKDHWFRGDYPNALETLQKSYTEQAWTSHMHMAYLLPFLDRLDDAKAHVATLLRLKPGFTIHEADAYYRMWCFEASYREKMRGALRSADLPE